jgi:hypothetical protein
MGMKLYPYPISELIGLPCEKSYPYPTHAGRYPNPFVKLLLLAPATYLSISAIIRGDPFLGKHRNTIYLIQILSFVGKS